MGIGRRFVVLTVCFVGLCSSTFVKADEYPSRMIKLVIGFGPGGQGDLTARLIGQKLSTSLGKPVIVENMPGAGGINAALAVARAPADGHTILLVSSQNATSPSLFKSLPYDWKSAFTQVTLAGYSNYAIFVTKNSPFKTLSDLLAVAKSDPSKVSIGTISAGSGANLAALLFASKAGLSITTVPYRTTGDVVTGVLSGQVPAGMDLVPGVLGMLQSGEIRALAVSTDKREAQLPEVPTIMESGVIGYNVSAYNGFAVAANTPNDIIMRLNKELVAALNDPDVTKRLSDLGVYPKTSTPEEFTKIFEAEVLQWRKVITDANLSR